MPGLCSNCPRKHVSQTVFLCVLNSLEYKLSNDWIVKNYSVHETVLMNYYPFVVSEPGVKVKLVVIEQESNLKDCLQSKSVFAI